MNSLYRVEVSGEWWNATLSCVGALSHETIVNETDMYLSTVHQTDPVKNSLTF